MIELPSTSIAPLVISVGAVYAIHKVLGYWNALRSIDNHPGRRFLMAPASLANFIFPPVKGVIMGRNFFLEQKYEAFDEAGCDVFSIVTALPSAAVMLSIADPTAIKEVTSSRARFPKPVHHYELVSFYGRNIIASEGEEWKKYRKISAPAFSDRNNKLVWDETLKIMQGLFDDVWGDQPAISVDHCVDITLPIALFVIGVAGFGRSISWKEDVVIPTGHTMTFRDALHNVAGPNIIHRLVLPDWAMSVTSELRTTKRAFEELRIYMSEMIHERQSGNNDKTERFDLFSSLLEANSNDLDQNTLTESELIGMLFPGVKSLRTDAEILGNIYVFLLAGHETTAHTLCFTFALLALYPDEQEKLYQDIMSVISDGRIPSYEEMPLFTYSMAVFNESLRMFAPVSGIPKVASEDTSITACNADGVRISIPVPKGCDILIDNAGLHYNPRYWEDPHTFKPERFLKDWPRDAFLPFSGGARACLGRKFFETEGIVIMTMLVSKYKITIKEEPQFSGETFEQRKARVLKCRQGLTAVPVRTPLVFTRRA